ncbi:MAG TPA: ATP-binding protein [Candidatus Saccharimonadales bacterium]|jgi:PAS domain S-box-containing protein
MPANKKSADPIVHTNSLNTIDYKKFFEVLPDQYIAVLPDDPIFTIAAENESHAKLALVEREKTLGRPIFEVFPDISEKYKKTGVNDVMESFRRVIKTKLPDIMETIQFDLKRPDGTVETRYWRLIHYPLFNEDGTLSLIFQSTHDITGEVMTDRQLARTKLQLDEALSVGLVATYAWDVPTDIVTGDKNLALMFGVSDEDVNSGVPLSIFTNSIHENDRERVVKQIGDAIKSEDTFSSDYRTVVRDGTIRWVIARGRIKRDNKGKAISLQGALVDITERKLIENNLSYLAQASAVLTESLDYKQTLQTIADLMVPDIADWCTVQILDEDNELQQVALAHKDPDKVKWAIALREKQGPQDMDLPTGVPNVIRTGKPEFYPIITDELLVAASKSEEELKLTRELGLSSVIIVPLKTNRKTVGAITLIMAEQKRHYVNADLEMAVELANRASLAMTNASLYEDAQNEIAERARLEAELQVANEELERRVEIRTAELEETNLNLQRSNQELQDFAYVASHDLQEPLRKIQAFGNLLETEYAAQLGEGKDYLSRMRNAAARMSALIEDILSFSRVTTKGRNFTPVNLRTVTQEVISDLEVRIDDTKATINIGDLPTIQADAMQMRQLLQNLIANALKFRRDGVNPVITVRAGTESKPGDKMKYCRLEIEDNGLGFDEKYLDRIFAVFQRLHNRETYEGTGIGLAVCRKIVERHGGSITATSKLGKGSTFIISLPIKHKKGENLL